jgi:hypothetical protein
MIAFSWEGSFRKRSDKQCGSEGPTSGIPLPTQTIEPAGRLISTDLPMRCASNHRHRQSQESCTKARYDVVGHPTTFKEMDGCPRFAPAYLGRKRRGRSPHQSFYVRFEVRYPSRESIRRNHFRPRYALANLGHVQFLMASVRRLAPTWVNSHTRGTIVHPLPALLALRSRSHRGRSTRRGATARCARVWGIWRANGLSA